MPEPIRLHFVEKFSEGDTDAQLTAMRKYFTFVGPDAAEVIFCASVIKMPEALEIMRSRNLPLIVYCWDYYLWAHEGKHDTYNWPRYAEMMRSCAEVLVPSAAQQLRLKELLSIDSTVVKTGAPTYEMPVSDGNFILDPLRYYPEENKTWAEEAAKELNIPLIHSEHQFSTEEFRKLVASCTFLTSCVREASTGALTLMEGLYLGKKSLVSDSPYQGARDYVGPYGVYFKYDSFDDLKAKMKQMWEERPKVDIQEARAYMSTISYDDMARGIYESAYRHIKTNRAAL